MSAVSVYGVYVGSRTSAPVQGRASKCNGDAGLWTLSLTGVEAKILEGVGDTGAADGEAAQAVDDVRDLSCRRRLHL